jgi:hypothetical protein
MESHSRSAILICHSPLGFLNSGPYGDRFANFRHYRGVEVKVRGLPRRRQPFTCWFGDGELTVRP